MSFVDDFWLGATASQRSMRQVINYGAAFYGNATLQALKLGIEAPMTFWNAVARANGAALQVDVAAEVETVVAAEPVAAPAPKVEVAPEPTPEPTPEPEPVVEANPLLLDAPRGGKADDLTSLSGVGAKLSAALNEFGIYHFDQIAALNEDGIDWLNQQQPGFKALVKRFDLVAQAKAAS